MPVLQSKKNEQQPDELFEFTNGIAYDQRLVKQEVAVQNAWMKGLKKLGIVSDEDVKNAKITLDKATKLILEKKFEWNVRDEDIHMHLERFVTEKCGDLGKRMHLGRSRNDLIATTLRLYVKDTLYEVEKELDNVIDCLEKQAKNTWEVIVPGMTHLQHGQPVRFGHILNAYVQMFKRDKKRIIAAQNAAVDYMPMGSAALAGTPLDLNLAEIANDLGFKNPTSNSYDAVGDRDFMLDGLNAFAETAVHLARLAEDSIYYSSTAVALIKLPARWSTGSSIMPNKRNPDVPELTRGKSAHIIAAQNNGHVLVRTVPTSYGSDLHELKQVYMRGLDELMACLKVWPGFINEMQVDAKRAAELCNTGHILATEIADSLVANGAAFRDAYKAVAMLVALAEEQSVQIHELDVAMVNEELDKLGLPKFDKYDFTFKAAIARRTNNGGTA